MESYSVSFPFFLIIVRRYISLEAANIGRYYILVLNETGHETY